jgi:hypothetical protein
MRLSLRRGYDISRHNTDVCAEEPKTFAKTPHATEFLVWHRDALHIVAPSLERRSGSWFLRMESRTDQQGLPLGADHFVLLIAHTDPVNEIVERPALALRFPHDELRRVQFHYIELQPLAARGELNGQA